MYVNENINTPVAGEYDVAVCGGGFAGISAALAAARMGKKTVLFERQFMLGGLATAGLITIYLPLCNGLGHQVSFGIAQELFMLSISHGAEDRYPDNWLTPGGDRGADHKRFEVQYNAQLFAIMAERLLLEAGVDVRYGTYVVGVGLDRDRISHLITESKSGRCAYRAASVVDATGDCDIAHFAGVPTDTFHAGNTPAAWYYSHGSDGYHLNMLGYFDVRNEGETHEGTEIVSRRRFGGLDAAETSEYMYLTHSSVYTAVLKRKENDPCHFPVTMATVPQLRMTRKIVGEYELSEQDAHKRFDDSVGMVSNWKERGPIYEVPFRSLYSRSVKNLICAGRCTAATQEMWDIMRVIPCCAVTGQAAGVAAAMTDDFSAIDLSSLQRRLREDGVLLHEDEL